MILHGDFNPLGETYFTATHKYTLPPYLKNKYGFGNDYDFYKDSVRNWAELHKIKYLAEAQENRDIVVERSLIASQVARGGLKLDLAKAEKNEMTARLNRFIGFQDYQDLDLLLGLK